LGLEPGDKLRFAIAGSELEATLTGIYRQKGIQTRFWFEGIFSTGALDPFIHRYVGATYMTDQAALAAQRQIATLAPNVVTVRTADLLATARDLLGKAVAGLAVVAVISLTVSLLVLTGVVAANRGRQVYEAAILHALGARPGAIRHSLYSEYLLLAIVTSAFAILIGSAIALPLLEYRLKLAAEFPLSAGILTALGISYLALHLGASFLLRRLQLSPAVLLRERS
jgi:putative ABC transport system permease protein